MTRGAIRTDIVAALDLGAATARCVIAQRGEDGAITPLGVGHQTLRRGAACAPADIETAARLLAVAADEAMRMAGCPMPPAMAVLSGAGIETRAVQGVAAIGAQGVQARTVQTSVAAAERAAARRGMTVLGLTSARFRIDGAPEAILDPLGRPGSTLLCEAAALLAPDVSLAALTSACTIAGLPLAGMAPAPIAAALAIAPPADADSGVFIADLGATHVSLALVLGGEVVWAGAVPMGADCVTDALAHTLATTRAAAERVKIAHVDLSGAGDPKAVVEFARLSDDGRLDAGLAQRAALDAAARGAWLGVFEAVRAVLDRLDPNGRMPVAITGGGAMTLGLCAIAERGLGRKVRLGRPSGFGVLANAEGGPGYALACGALACAGNADQSRLMVRSATLSAVRPGGPAVAGLVRNVGQAWTWLRENF